MIPLSLTWQTISLASCQMSSVPGDRACRNVFAATSLTASTRSIVRSADRPASWA